MFYTINTVAALNCINYRLQAIAAKFRIGNYCAADEAFDILQKEPTDCIDNFHS
ncbi:hypothetical protein [Halotia branconii]|uniref:Uncharacterized protein n=1 Tax=Halotia branconii CENA392 TaxID=1539056 RepID=A0AAJ6NU88_9CYAN|nr:hypothetical protein [Halotia branconii]WGV26705.1 hypothetical protein QI031_04135 [Halotia branconii CENA392]